MNTLSRRFPVRRPGIVNRLWFRLSLSFSLIIIFTSLFAISLSILSAQGQGAIRRIVINALREQNGLVDQLEELYRVTGDWSTVAALIFEREARFVPPGAVSPVNLVFADAGGTILYDGSGELVGQSFLPSDSQDIIPILVDGRLRGYLAVDLNELAIGDVLQSRIVDEMIRILIGLLVAGTLLGMIAGVLISRSLTTPLNRLAEAARQVQQGNFHQRLKINGSTETREVATAFNEMTAAIEHAEQLRRNLMADVAHELRTPLSVLQSNLYAILDEVRPLNREQITSLYDQTRVLSRLVTDLHDLAQADAGQLSLQRTPTDFAALLEDVVTTFEVMAADRDLTISTRVPDSLPPVTVDAGRMRQVLYNLMHNAVRHTPTHGSITIAAGWVDGQLEVSVQDTGEGIAPEHLPLVFERFYRADSTRSRATGGTGLGLAIARGIVEAHHGTLTAASSGQPGEGACFTLRLPGLNGASREAEGGAGHPDEYPAPVEAP